MENPYEVLQLIAMIVAGLGGMGGAGAVVHARRNGGPVGGMAECRAMFAEVKAELAGFDSRLDAIEKHIVAQKAYAAGQRDAVDATGPHRPQGGA